MKRIHRRVRSDQSAEEVFAFLSDFTTTEEWDPGTVRTERVAGDGGVGTTYHNVSRFLGRETELEYTVEAFEPPRRIVLVGRNRTVTARDTMTLEPGADGGSTLDYLAEFRFHGLAGLTEPLLGPFLTRLGDQAAARLRTVLNRSAG